MVPDALAESAFLVGPVGPAMTVGVLPPSDTDLVDHVVPTRMQSSSVFECAGPLGPVGTLPLPAVWDQSITQLPVEGLVGDCGDVINENITVHEQFPVSQTSPLREGSGRPILDGFPTYVMSPAGSVDGPVPAAG